MTLVKKQVVFSDPAMEKQMHDICEFFAPWDDMRFPFTQTKRGALNKPDFDETNIGLLFPQNDASEKIYIVAQMPHNYMVGSDIYPHVHWQQSANTAVTWKMDYKWFNVGDAVPAAFTTISTSTGVFTYTSGNLMQVSSFGPISGASKNLSSFLLIKVYRDDNTTTGDVLGFEFDIHIQGDTAGSREQWKK